MVDNTLAISGESVPYVIDCAYVNTTGTKLYFQQYEDSNSQFVDPVYPLPQKLLWPQTLVQVGDSAEQRCSRMGEVFYHAFGYPAPRRLPIRHAT
jgi:hypothetical protein